MKHTLALVLMVFGIVGCATVESVTKLTDMELCFHLDPIRYVTTPGEKEIIRAEIKKRNLDCRGF